MKSILYLSAVALLSVSLSAKAEVWGSYIVGGTACNYGNTSVIANGSDLSILFDEFNVNMDGRLGGLQARKTCNFRISVTPPRGFYLARLRQVFSGGVLKSRRSSGSLNIRTNIGTDAGASLPIVFPRGQEITPEDFDSIFEEVHDSLLTVASCGGTKTFGLNMSLAASRDSYSDSLIVGVDSVDSSLTTKVVLIPEYRLCR